MDILKITGIEPPEFIKKLNLEKLTSNDLLGNPTALKEELSYKLPPLIPIELDDSKLKLKSSANSNHSTQLFNEEKDKDKDGILGKNGEKNTVLPFNMDTPMLKHTLAFNVTLGATINTGNLEFGVESGGSLKTIAYLKHGKEEKVKDALLEDVKKMPFAYFISNVKRLNVNEAVSIVSDASLGITLNFSISDVASAGLSGLAKYMSSEETICLEINSGASVAINFSLKGAFKLVFVKLSGKKYDLYVQSAVSSTLKGGLNLGLEISLNNPEVLSDLLEDKLDSILEQITTLDSEELDDFEKKLKELSTKDLTLLDLTSEEQKVADFLIERLDIGNELDKLTALTNKIGSLRAELGKAFKMAAETKIKAAFGYEYSRISTEKTLLRAEMEEQMLNYTHKDLVLFNTLPFIDLATKPGNSNKIKIKEYFKESNLKIRREWGISIGIGKYRLGGSDIKELESKRQKTIENNKLLEKVAYDGFRKYKESGDLGGFGNDYWVGFNVSMGDYKEPFSITAGDFDYGFSFFLEHREKRFRKNEKTKLMKLMDMAQLWNCISKSAFTEQVEELWALIGNKSKSSSITFSYHLNINPDVFDTVKQMLFNMILNRPEQHLSLLSTAFGKATPFDPNFKHRKDSQLRGNTYGELWQTYFKNEGFAGSPAGNDFRYYTDLAEYFFKDKEIGLSKMEGAYVNQFGQSGAGDNVWFGGLIRINSPARNVVNFSNGIEALLGGILTNDPKYNKLIKGAFNNMEDCWKMQFCIKAIGIYFIDLASLKGIQNLVESKLIINYKDSSGNDRVKLLQKGEKWN
ncbi:MAG: hypothetical protein AAF688_14385 [Bacteroidota bacterium]